MVIKTNVVKINQVVSKKKSLRKAKQIQPAKLRKSLTPGTIVILLSGAFRGKKAVMLKQMDKTGLILVTGPYGVNGVPIRRVNQRYVIATSTKVDVSGVNTSKFTDEYFTKKKSTTKEAAEVAFLAKSAKPATSAAFKADQAEVDKSIIAAVGKVPLLKKYLKAKFALSNGQMAHELKF